MLILYASKVMLKILQAGLQQDVNWELPDVQTGFRKGRGSEVKSLSRVWLLATPWTVAHQAPPPIGFSRQEYWSGLPFPSLQGIFPTQGSNPGLPHCRQTLYRLSFQGSPKDRGTSSQTQCSVDHRESKEIPEKHLLCWLHKNLWLCGSQQTVENS